MVTTINNPVASQMIQGAETVLRQAGYAILLSANHHTEQHETEILSVFKARRFDLSRFVMRSRIAFRLT